PSRVPWSPRFSARDSSRRDAVAVGHPTQSRGLCHPVQQHSARKRAWWSRLLCPRLLIKSPILNTDAVYICVIMQPAPQGFGNSAQISIRGIVSRRPTGDGESYVEATYGTDERLDLRAAGELTLIPDK